MAQKPKPANKEEAPEKKLERDGLARLKACRSWKDLWVLDFKECYFFAAPHRQRQISSQTQPNVQRLLDAPELNTDLAFDIVQEFVTEVVNTYMPEAQPWCERGPGMFLPDGVWDQVKDEVKKDDAKIFAAMKASNLYPELTKAFYPDLAIGTVALWIDRPHPSQPIVVSAIPLREFECNLGPYGELDDRFAVRYTRNTYVREIIGEDIWDKVPEEIKKTCDKKPSERTEVRFGFWRLWDRFDDEVWQAVVYIGDDLVHSTEIAGEGSCPLLGMRWNPSADWPWGLGPLIQGLPSFRQVDELESMLVENVELHIAGPITYPNDSFTNIEQGLESRMAYPITPGSEGAVKRIYEPGPPEPGVYEYEKKEHRLRRLFFVDFPQQTGDTPPTLGQWLDEMARAQRRIGTPGLPFWREGPAKIFLRFKYLLERAQSIMPIKVDGKAVGLQPRNPAQAAAEQQDVAKAQQAIALLGQAFPEEFKMYVDGKATMEAILEKMRVTLLKFRAPDDVKNAVGMISQLVGARHVAGAPNTAPGPAA